MYVSVHVHAWCSLKSEQDIDSLELELQSVVSGHMGGGYQTRSSERAISGPKCRTIVLLQNDLPLHTHTHTNNIYCSCRGPEFNAQ